MSKFQHRHYKAVADVLLRHRSELNKLISVAEPEFMAMLRESDRSINLFCNMFAEDNPRFDRQRFKDACYGDARGKDFVA